MKKISFILALVFAKIAVAQSLSVSLDMNGVYQKGTSEVRSGYKSGKACRADEGRYLGRGRCRIVQSSAKIAIQKSEISDAYEVKIQNKSAPMKESISMLAANINVVQLVALVPEMESCKLTVMFTSPTTLATRVSGDCSDEMKETLNIDGFNRTK